MYGSTRILDRFLLATKLLKYLSSVLCFFIEECWMMELETDVTADADQLVFSFQSLKLVRIRINVML